MDHLREYAEFLLSRGIPSAQIETELQKFKQQAARAAALDDKPKTRPRPRGSGSVYQKAGSQFWWCSYFVNGERHQVSTEQTDRWKATKFLQKQLSEAAAGRVAPADVEGATVGQLVAACFTKKENGEIAHKDGRTFSTDGIEHEKKRYTKNLAPVFGKMRARKVTEAALSAYIKARKSAGAKPASINREMAILQRSFKLAKIPNPGFPRLGEKDFVRTGFLDDSKRAALLAECGKIGLWLRAMVTTAATFGFRRGELAHLRVSAIDLKRNTLRLESSETKTGEARQVKLTPEVRMLLEACTANKKPDDLVFTRDDGGAVGDFRKVWDTCCDNAKVPGLLFHDLRRSAVRGMVRAGVPERVAMKISGHKTRSVFDRYHIVSDTDMDEATQKIAAATSATFTATVGDSEDVANDKTAVTRTN